ncbi:tripartite-type tricarboxylate transporter receptor subunit TctC [Nonomuraea polychroma]|uniref:Tripartite-type tricarboxylate transporter receptor subunit TctC n=1 Tax=Nonomuraea polychroma TaxID=46176 RepID=A0A438LYQ5_9ACTN|nr:tripartite tricarboxylate transporter substrate binding protein [Nonomuraea polychroma]RVX38665.1 tripartite-type tricarboxylate transporter receptor subunit TctC [Nonomuraea polychroma]
MRIGVLLAAVALAASACSVQGGSADKSAAASGYPNKPVEFTVPTDPGGSTDLLTRALAKSIEQPLGAKAVVVNKPGANGKIAGKDVFGSKPDGYRVAVMPQSLFAIGPLMLNDADPVKLTDMTFIKGLAVEDYVLVVPADSTYKTLKDLVEAPSVKYGTTGPGTGSQLSQTLLFGLAKTNAAPVPFDGGAPTVTAVLGGKVDAASVQIAEGFKQVQAGKMRALAVFSDKRLEAMPEVPTAKESGYDVVVDQRRFVAGPAGLPAEVRDKLAAAIDKAIASPEYNEILKANYIGRWDANGEQVGTQLNESLQRFDKLAKDLGIDLKAQQQ